MACVIIAAETLALDGEDYFVCLQEGARGVGAVVVAVRQATGHAFESTQDLGTMALPTGRTAKFMDYMRVATGFADPLETSTFVLKLAKKAGTDDLMLSLSERKSGGVGVRIARVDLAWRGDGPTGRAVSGAALASAAATLASESARGRRLAGEVLALRSQLAELAATLELAYEAKEVQENMLFEKFAIVLNAKKDALRTMLGGRGGGGAPLDGDDGSGHEDGDEEDDGDGDRGGDLYGGGSGGFYSSRGGAAAQPGAPPPPPPLSSSSSSSSSSSWATSPGSPAKKVAAKDRRLQRERADDKVGER